MTTVSSVSFLKVLEIALQKHFICMNTKRSLYQSSMTALKRELCLFRDVRLVNACLWLRTTGLLCHWGRVFKQSTSNIPRSLSVLYQTTLFGKDTLVNSVKPYLFGKY